MVRQKRIVMEPMTKEEAYEASIARSIKLHTPYLLVAKHKYGLTQEREWQIVYQAATKARRSVVVDGIRKQTNGKYLLRLLERAWAEGVFHANWMKPGNENS